MSQFRRIGAVLLVIFCSMSLLFAQGVKFTTDEAEDLKQLGLFLGTSNGFELDRMPSRLEAVVILVRLLGKEEEAKAKSYDHPFLDVEPWGDVYVGYAYEKGLTRGISSTQFGSDTPATEVQFFTFVLRALGYDDTRGDFQWQEAKEKAQSIDLIPEKYEAYSEQGFLRGHCVLIAHQALWTPVNEASVVLIDQLIAGGVIPLDQADALKTRYMVKDAGVVADEKIQVPLENTVVTHGIELKSYMGRPAFDVLNELKALYGEDATIWLPESTPRSAYISLKNKLNQEVALFAEGDELNIVKVFIGYNSYGGASQYGVIVEGRKEMIGGYTVHHGVASLLDQIGVTKDDFSPPGPVSDFNTRVYRWAADGGHYSISVVDDFSRIFGLSFDMREF